MLIEDLHCALDTLLVLQNANGTRAQPINLRHLQELPGPHSKGKNGKVPWDTLKVRVWE